MLEFFRICLQYSFLSDLLETDMSASCHREKDSARPNECGHTGGPYVILQQYWLIY